MRDTSEKKAPTGRQLALVVGGALVLLTAVWFLILRGGGGEERASAPIPPVTIAAVEPSPAEVPVVTGDPDDAPVETFEVFAPKDPFEPLVGSGGGTSETATGNRAPTGAAPDPGEGGNAENVAGHTVRLVDVFEEGGAKRAQVQVDGTVYTVDEGETFATNFQLLSISGDCASMLYGDDQFTICEGEEILK